MAVRVIHVHTRRALWSTETIGYETVPFQGGLTVASVRPPGVDASWVAWRNNAYAEPDEAILDGDHVTFAPQPFGAEFSFFKLVFVLFASTALSMILAPKLPPLRRGEESSPTYGFGGISTSRGEGFPVPVLYGRHRVGGVLISETLESEAFPPRQIYKALISYGLGPYYALGDRTTDTTTNTSTNDPSNPIPTGIEINGNRAESYDDVTVNVRLGSLGQTPIPGFSFADTNVEVGQTLTQATVTTAANATYSLTYSNFNNAGTSNTLFSAYGRTQDYASAAIDAAKITLRFPYGLYTYDQATGGLDFSKFQLAARYIELDGGGTPITTGGPEGDGYVRLAPMDILSAKQQGDFSVDYGIDFYDPQTYAHPVRGEAITFDGTNDAAEQASPTLPTADPTTGANLNTAGSIWGNFSIAAWVRIDDVTRAGNFVFDHLGAAWNTGTPRGFRLGFEFYISSSCRPYFQWGDGSSKSSMREPSNNGALPTFLPDEGTLFHIALTSKRVGSLVTLRMYGNGVLRHEVTTTTNIRSAGSSRPIQCGHTSDSSVSGTDAHMSGLVDELFFSNNTLSEANVSLLYNGGLGKYATSTGFSNVLGIWHFDTSSGAAAWTTPDSVSGGIGALTMYTNYGTSTKGSLLTSSNGGKVYQPNTGSLKRSRYRLEVCRNNVDSTSASTQDEAEWQAVAWRLDETLSYPGHTLLGIKVRASDQMHDTIPKITSLIDGRIVGVWDGASTTNPTFAYQFTANPAWIALDYALDKVSGLGATFGTTDLDILSFFAWSKVCDQLVYGHHGQYADGTGWTNMQYVQTGAAGVGYIRVTFDPDQYTALRQYLDVGDYLGFTGVNIVSADINTPEGNRHTETLPTLPGGWQIFQFFDPLYAIYVNVNTAPTNPWTSGNLLSVEVGGTGNLTGTVEDREFRHRCHLNIDEQRPAWEWLLSICATGRARPVRDGKRLRVVWDSAKSPVDLVTQSSIIRDSFEITYGGAKDRPNAYSVDIYDADSNWERSTFPIEHPTVQNATTLESPVTESKTFPGITSRAQAMRQGLYELNSNVLLNRSGRFQTNVSGLPLEPGDVVTIAHDLAGWAIGGRVTAQMSDTVMRVDRDVTVTSALTVHTVVVKDSNTGSLSTSTVDTALTGSGAYPRTVSAGSDIVLVSALTFVPQTGDEYSYTTPSATSFDAQIVGTTMDADGTKTIEWLEYDAAVYEDDDFDDLTEVESATASPSSSATIPTIETVGLASRHVTAQGGQHMQVVTVSWNPTRETLAHIGSVAIWAKDADDDSDPWEKVAEVASTVTTTTFVVPDAEHNSVLRVAVQPISRSGSRVRPEVCAHGAVRLDTTGPAPGAPTGLAAVMDEDQAVYSWTPDRNDLMLFTELRRGGWILGQPIGTAPPGVTQLGPTRDWSGELTNTWADPSALVMARHRSGTGAYSDYASVRFDPSVYGTFAFGQFTNANFAFEDGFVAYTTRTNITTHTLPSGRTALKFSGSNLTGYVYFPDTPIVAITPLRVRRVYVEAYVEAANVHPTAFADWPAMDSPALRHWTMEGPLVIPEGETENCSLTLEIKVTDDSGTSEWKPFRPGIYRMHACQMRVVATRPNDTYDVHIYRIGLRVLRVPFSHNSESAVDGAARAWTLRL